MKITVLTLFPEIIRGFFENSIMARAVSSGLISYEIVNWRDFADDRHRTCDDAPFGGGAGMVIKTGPLSKALDSVGGLEKRVILPSPSGKLYNQEYARQLSLEDELVFVCGHYEGIDQRVIDRYVDDEISIGDYVISSGEIASLTIIDALYRLIPGVISAPSLEEESFTGNLLEYPQYTRPETYCSIDVPSILLSGHHAKIAEWRLKKRLEKTLRNRRDLLRDSPLSPEASKMLNMLMKEDNTDQGDINHG